ncbi:bifunctional diguanylate cyclase/phosphodiesterase [Aliidiomarina indica]|uniref:bifunctional diguanylate cyclase/phosphodiesterase n=1 Tax=Aliidiomarina indica TaxID=2749147 RepID=UPI001E49CEBA|nr:EAL domain-containing protein [Aliidiomarina indica]
MEPEHPQRPESRTQQPESRTQQNTARKSHQRRSFRTHAASLRAFVNVSVWLLVTIALIASATLWFRTVDTHQKNMETLADYMGRGIENHFSLHELFLQSVGQEVLFRDVFGNPESANQYLARIAERQTDFAGLGFVDRNGMFIATSFTDNRAQGVNLLDIEGAASDFQRLLRQPRFTISRPYFSPMVDEWVIPIRTPVFNDNGDLMGFMTAGLRLNTRDAPWSPITETDGAEVALIRPDGYVNFIYPTPESNERLERIYRDQVSLALRELIRRPDGHYLYQRPGRAGNTIANHAMVMQMPELELSVVVLRPRSDMIQDWLQRMVILLLIMVASSIALYISYRRAQSLLQSSDAEIQQRQQALMNSLERYSRLTMMLPVGVYQLRIRDNGDHEFVYLSQRARDVFGLRSTVPLADALEAVMECMHSDDLDDFFATENAAIENHVSFNWAGRFIINSRTRWLSIQSQPGEHDGQGRIWHGVMMDVTDQHRAQEQIDSLAHYDALTHLPNRTLLIKRLLDTIRRNKGSKQRAAVMSIDLDNFKLLNDNLGQEEGDRVLRTIGQRLQALVREDDTVARISGDEFVVLTSGMDADEETALRYTNELVKRIIEKINKPIILKGDSYLLTASIGVTVLGQNDTSVEQVLQQADQAMYEAKDAGRNTVVFFDENLQSRLNNRLELQRDLHRGLAQDEFELYYQPKVDANRKIVGVEGLSRWHHPTRGMVSPGIFIPIAEESSDILKLGEWVVRTACSQIVEWSTHPIRKHWTVAINVSVKQLRGESFVDQVAKTLSDTGADPKLLVLEITESMLLGDTEAAIGKMDALRSMGVRFALDDFGTGYSSLSYLQRLPIDQLKIDQSFVQKLDGNSIHQKLTRSIISLGHSLELQIVAEGVESEFEYDILKRQGCDIFQGYLFSKPVHRSMLTDNIE